MLIMVVVVVDFVVVEPANNPSAKPTPIVIPSVPRTDRAVVCMEDRVMHIVVAFNVLHTEHLVNHPRIVVPKVVRVCSIQLVDTD
mmetsp:Transcript_13768/g.20874  ORF Transcript_13768/g.20874 Transcript_13768/m.20874 type:complete len:85 (-) Transcript_13768:181-435(-)